MRFFLCLSFLFATSFAFSQDIQLTVEGLLLAKPGIKGESMEDLRPFNKSQGTAISLRLVSPKKAILKIDSDKSKVLKFTDDTGVDLKKVPNGVNFFGSEFAFVSFTKDKLACSFDVNGASMPSKNAKSINCSVKLVLQLASETKEIKTSSLALVKDTKFEITNKKMSIKKVGKPSWGDAKLEIDLQSNRSFSDIKNVFIESKDGKKTVGKSAGSYSSSFGDEGSFGVTYQFAETYEEGVLVFELYSDIEEKIIEKDFAVTLGL